MKHSVAHHLGPEKAKQAAEAAIRSYTKRFADYHPEARWTSSTRAEISFAVKGFSLKGALDVQPTSIDMDLDVPFVLRPFRGKALSVIEGEIKKWVAKAEAGDLDSPD